MEQLHESYKRRLADERGQVKEERQRADAWICNLKGSNQIEKWSYDERIGQLERVSSKSKKVTIVLPDELTKMWAEPGGTAVRDSLSDRTSYVCISDNYFSAPGQRCSCSVSLHGEANSYVATCTGGSVMSEYGSCSAGGQPFTPYSCPTQPTVARGPSPLLPISRPFLQMYANVTPSCSNLLEHSSCTSP